MGEEIKQLVLLGTDLETKDYLLENEIGDMTFHDIVEFLHEKHEKLMADFMSLPEFRLLSKEAFYINFYYVDDRGGMFPIERSEEVKNILQISDTVSWEITTYTS